MHRAQRKILATLAICAIALLAGCGTRTVLVPAGEPVRIAEPTKTSVWVKTADGKWVKSSGKVTIPEGWYALSIPDDK